MAEIDSHEQEVRFALVLYGGVSLAVYINGVMQEMLQVVRSTAVPEAELKGSAKVYRKLGAMLGPDRNIKMPGQGAPVKTKFKIDIISGTSAGGINGIFLAKALANGAASLNQIQELWFTEGAIEALLNDHTSYRGIPVNQPKETKSLLNSRRMYLKLLNAFDGMDLQDPTGPTQPLANEIDLFATTTDIEGIPVPIQLFDNVVYERRYRNAFHFRFIEDERNDFEHDNNPFLAFAARSTSSFPFAFEPMQLCNIDEILKSTTAYANKKYCFAESTRWHKYFTNYLQGVIDTAKPFPQRPFGDGGYLNNAPFSYAVDALLQRQAAVPVDRKLLYVEPSPSHPEEEAAPREAPNAIENSLDALIVIPGYQTIRNDLMRVLERNRQASKINKTLGEVENEIQGDESRCQLPAKEEDRREIQFLEDSCYRAYYRMRSAEVTDRIATMLARIYCIEEDSAYFYALRSLVRAWRETEYHVAPGGPVNRWQDFLKDFDLPYRVRRLRFILKKLDGLNNLQLPLGHPSRADAERILRFGLGKPEARDLPAGLKDVRAAVFRQYENLSKLLRRLLEPILPEDKDTPEEMRIKTTPDPAETVRKKLPERSKVLAVLANILGEVDPIHHRRLTTRETARKTNEPADLEALCDRKAAGLFGGEGELHQQLREGLHDAGEELRKMLAGRLESVFEELTKIFVTPAGTIAARFFYCFDLFDSIQYPMAFNTEIGEAEIVQIVRVCPEDATALGPDDVQQRRAKLKGLVMAHFGAFLDQDWRVNDLLWGRLDAAERVITALLPWTDDNVLRVRNQLIDEAQYEILLDFKAQKRLLNMAARQAAHCGPESKVSGSNIREIISVAAPLPGANRAANAEFMDVWKKIVPSEPKRTLVARSLARATEITGHILEAISNEKGVGKKQAAWITNAGRALWGMVEISVPRSIFELLGKYWLSLLSLVAAVLLVAGLIGGQKGVTGTGWALLGIVLVLSVFRALLSSWMRGGRTLWGFIQGLLLLIVFLLLLLGGHTAYKFYECDLAQWLSSHGCHLIDPQCR